jgi:hypothetical protein
MTIEVIGKKWATYLKAAILNRYSKVSKYDFSIDLLEIWTVYNSRIL